MKCVVHLHATGFNFLWNITGRGPKRGEFEEVLDAAGGRADHGIGYVTACSVQMSTTISGHTKPSSHAMNPTGHAIIKIYVYRQDRLLGHLRPDYSF